MAANIPISWKNQLFMADPVTGKQHLPVFFPVSKKL
jgi:hypothetical protein